MGRRNLWAESPQTDIDELSDCVADYVGHLLDEHEYSPWHSAMDFVDEVLPSLPSDLVPQAVYGGVLQVVSGVLRIGRAKLRARQSEVDAVAGGRR